MRLTFVVLYLVFYVLGWLCFLGFFLSSSIFTINFRTSWGVFLSYFSVYTNIKHYLLGALFSFSGLLPSIFFFTKGGLLVFSIRGWSYLLLVLIVGNFFFTIMFYLYVFKYKNVFKGVALNVENLSVNNYIGQHNKKNGVPFKRTRSYYSLFFVSNFVLFFLFSAVLFFSEFFLIIYSLVGF